MKKPSNIFFFKQRVKNLDQLPKLINLLKINAKSLEDYLDNSEVYVVHTVTKEAIQELERRLAFYQEKEADARAENESSER